MSLAPDKDLAIRVQKAAAALKALEDLPGYPRNSKAFAVTAKLFSDIVHFKPPREISPECNPMLDGYPTDADWITEKILEQHHRMPTMQQVRSFFCKYLPASKGRYEDLEF
jgi:hypothetical protein